MRHFFIALQFLTRLPVPALGEVSSAETGRSVLFYPPVGLVIGLLLGALALITPALGPPVQAALILAAWVLVTGALHLDGLADSADAWIGGHGDRDRTLAIMKDPYCGPAGVVVLVLVLLLKFTALHALLEAGHGLMLVLAPVVGRTALPLLFMSTPYQRPRGLATALWGELPRREAKQVIAVTVIVLILLSGGRAIVPLILTALGFMYLRRLMLQRLGGGTGDTAGATVEIAEMLFLLGALLI